MNSLRTIATVSRRFSSATGAGAKGGKAVWLGDIGAYPIMAGIGFCVSWTSGFTLYYWSKSPDVAITKTKSEFLRGQAPRNTTF